VSAVSFLRPHRLTDAAQLVTAESGNAAAADGDQPVDELEELIGVDADTLRIATRADWRRTWRRPYEIPNVIAGNAALLLVLWWLVPHASLTRLHGNFALPVCLASWMFADVPATNTLAPDRVRVLAALDDPVHLRRLLLAKNATLWLIATPIALLATLCVAIQTGDWVAGAITALTVATVPLGLLGLSCWVGILWPYHPRPIAWRLERRKQLRQDARWITLVFAPYVLVPALATVLLAPSIVLWKFAAKDGLDQRLTNLELLLGVVVAIAVAFAAWFWGTRGALRLIRSRHDELAAYLADPDLG
jgi:hypothetical protein